MPKITINCDMGEGFGLYKMGDDDKMFEIIDVANVACGFHASDPCIMNSTIKCAKLNNVRVGAHPSFPDLQGFGRRAMSLTPDEVKQFVTYQVGALKGFLEANQMELSHVKPHGSLYGVASHDDKICRAIVEAVSVFGVPLIGAPNTKFEDVTKEYNVPFWPEFFADLEYDDDGHVIISRTHKAIEPSVAVARTKLALEKNLVRSVNGKDVSVAAKTVCVHSDTPGAVEIARAVRKVLDTYNMQNSIRSYSGLSIKKVLIANRGEIACRIIKTCKAMGIETVSISEVQDSNTMHTIMSDENVDLDEGTKYTDINAIVDICRKKNVDAVHPGYGFLSENPKFCESIEATGISFLGPTSDTIRVFGLKHAARDLSVRVGVPVVPGSGLLPDSKQAVMEARKIGYPVMLKATGGGGGIGITVCDNEEVLLKNYDSCLSAAENYFGNSGIYLEKFYPKCRHIEIQIFGNGNGKVIHLGERECSVQRRNQKVIEETPSPFLVNNDMLRGRMVEAAIKLAEAVNYRSAGTVEFLVVDEGSLSADTGKFFFLEMNTRLQVEHGITEKVTGVDLVEWMVLQANSEMAKGCGLDLSACKIHPRGHSIEVRLYAENPLRNFNPSPGLLTEVTWSEDVPSLRIDSWIRTGTQISTLYDALLAKVIVHDKSRKGAIQKMVIALAKSTIAGPSTNKEYILTVLKTNEFILGNTLTQLLKSVCFVPLAIEVIHGGMETTVQDWPGRIGLRIFGIQPNGPMDDLAFRIANLMVGNSEGTCGLEITVRGPELLFHTSTVVAITGAPFDISIRFADGRTKVIQMWSRFGVPAKSTLRIGQPSKGCHGCRCYLAVAGGLSIPDYLGSKSTFPAFGYGGFQGRKLKSGDLLPLECNKTNAEIENVELTLPTTIIPNYQDKWEIKVLPGPQSDPDYVTPEGMDLFFSADWKVHYNSNRMGIRIVGPKPIWARLDGGEGGSHPSNINDNAYPLGGINCTGDSPVVLTIEGPSQGGFVCPFTIHSSELWKTGQVSPGEIINFTPISYDESIKISRTYVKYMKQIKDIVRHFPRLVPINDYITVTKTMRNTQTTLGKHRNVAVLANIPATHDRPAVQYRQGGDRYVMVEYGDPEASVDLNLRIRVKVLQDFLHLVTDTKTQMVTSPLIPGTLDAAPCLRTLLIQYDPEVIAQSTLVDYLKDVETNLLCTHSMVIPTKEIHLPFAFDDRWSKEATDLYMRYIRNEASYLPSNVDFIVENNGLKDKQELMEFVTGTPLLVAGVGFFVGCPFLVPINPLRILNVPKYNPARNYTASGAVGMGGPYSAIYPMESPGGYQLYGRTIQTWNTFGSYEPFSPDKPWLLNQLYQVIFDLVSEEELLESRRLAALGKYKYAIKDSVLDMAKHNAFVDSVKEKLLEVKEIRKRANKAMLKVEAELLRKHGSTSVQLPLNDVEKGIQETEHEDIPPGFKAMESIIVGCVKSVKVSPGDFVIKDETVICVVEAMKTELEIISEYSGKISKILVANDKYLALGDLVCVIKDE